MLIKTISEQSLKKLVIRIVLVIVIALQAFWICYMFMDKKEGFHSDEPWSYGFANSYYEPYLYATGNFDPKEPTYQKNFGEWLSGDVFRNYLTVNEDDAFCFDSIYYNTAYDQSPPLYCMLIHIICSFHKNSFSFSYAFLINLIAFIISQITIFLIIKTLSGSDLCSLFVCLLYGFSLAGLSTTIFLRMYALLTCFCLLYLYILLRIYIKKGEHVWFESVWLSIILLLGGLTHYSFYIFAFFMTILLLILVIYGEKEKKIKRCIHLSCISIAGVGLSFIFYPYAINSIFSQHDLQDSSVIKLPYWYNFETLLSYFSLDTLGVDWYYDRFDLLNTIAGIIVFLLIIVLACFICRKEKWFLPIKDKYIISFINFIKDKKQVNELIQKNTNWFAICMFASMWLTIMISAKICKIFEMGRFADRYIFFLMPIWDILVVYACFAFWKRLIHKSQIPAFIITLVLISGSLLIQKQGDSVYLFSGTNLKRLTEMTAESNCVVVTNRAWSLEWYSAVLFDVNQFFAVDITQYPEQISKLNDIADVQDEKKYYLVLEQACFTENDIENEDNTVSTGGIGFNTAGSDISEKSFLNLLLDSCKWIDNVEYVYTQYGFRGALDVFEITVSK